MPYLTNEELREIEEIVKKIKMEEKISDFTTLKNVRKLLEKRFSAEIQETSFVNQRAIGLLCVNEGEVTIILNKNSIYDFDACYTVLYLFGYTLMKEEDTFIYVYDEQSDLLDETALKASHFAETMMDF